MIRLAISITRVRWTTGCLIIAILPMLSACGKKEEQPGTEETLRDYSSLSLVAETHDNALRDEIARIEGERATLLEVNKRQQPPKESDDLNSRLEKAIPDLEQAARIIDRLSDYSPDELASLDPVRASELSGILRSYARITQMLRQATLQRSAVLWVDYTLGLAADLSFMDRMNAAYLLESSHAGVHLQENDVENAIECLERMFNYTRKLAAVWHIVPRLDAARLRDDACNLLSAIVEHPMCDLESQRRLRNLMIGQLANWTPESNCWIGDRAIGLHVYEMVRDGQYLSLLTPEESDRLRAERIEYATAKRVSANVDSDQLYYLQTMRRLIDVSDKPYFERGEFAAENQLQLSKLSDADTYPTVATELLLIDVMKAQRTIAADRARVEAWALAFAIATQTKPPSGEVNPETGKPYQVSETDGTVEVQGLYDLGDDITPRVPLRL